MYATGYWNRDKLQELQEDISKSVTKYGIIFCQNYIYSVESYSWKASCTQDSHIALLSITKEHHKSIIKKGF